jgi:hypothetical protein
MVIWSKHSATSLVPVKKNRGRWLCQKKKQLEAALPPQKKLK